jgi:outer membrane immunogenic protein
MKTTTAITLGGLVLSIISGNGYAADLATMKGPMPAATLPPLWTGVYAGLNLGGGWNANGGNGPYWLANGYNNAISNRLVSGALGGLQFGYNYQLTPLFVVGLETDFQGTTMGSGSNTQSSAYMTNLWDYSMGTTLNWFGTVRGRAGVAVRPDVLLYGTAGFAYGDVSRNGWVQNGSLQGGWTAGGGVEWMFLQNWSAKAEYLYTNISGGPSSITALAPKGYVSNGFTVIPVNVNNVTAWNTVRAGVNYHFALGATTSITGDGLSIQPFSAASLTGYSVNKPGNASNKSARSSASYSPTVSGSDAPSAAVSTPASPVNGLTPATGTLPNIALSDILHP